VDYAKVFAILAGAVNAAAFILYNVQAHRKKTTSPNITSWAVWASIVLLNVTSYWKMSGDWETSIMPLVGSIGCVGTFLFTLLSGRFSKIDLYDRIALCIGILAAFAWWYFHSASFANVVLQGAVAVGFIPMYRALWHSPRLERWPAWTMWTVAFAFGLIAVWLRDKTWQEYVYYVSCFCLHGAIIPLTLRNKFGGSQCASS
jgi:hypothetical protein